jgi:hypothetical protein
MIKSKASKGEAVNLGEYISGKITLLYGETCGVFQLPGDGAEPAVINRGHSMAVRNAQDRKN